MAVGGDDPPRVSFVMTELEDIDGIFLPVKTASRVKYTCFDVSRHYLAFGTTAGGVIVLQQTSLGYLKTLAVKEGPVCQVAFSPDESMVGFATNRGIVVVMEHNVDRGSIPPQRLQLSYDHKGTSITALQWNVSSSKLFVGDGKGKVSVVNVTTSRTRNIFQIPTSTLVRLDSKVVQMDFAQDHLLVSTLTRCYLCNTNREHFFQVGKKLRDGEYGACFYPGLRSNDPCTIYCARPGCRMWEVDNRGNVHCTHQFKNALTAHLEILISFRHEIHSEEERMENENKSHSAAFNKMFLIWPRSQDFPFVFTWSDQGTYIFDPKRAEVVLWTVDLKGIKDVRCQHADIYVHFHDGRFAKYTLMTVEHAVCRLYQQGLSIHGARLLVLKKLVLCQSRLNASVPHSFLQDMLQQASEIGDTLLHQNLKEVFSQLGINVDRSSSRRSSSAMSEPLHHGTYMANRFSRDVEDTPSSFSLSRWRSASPVLSNNSGSLHSSPSRHSGSGSPSRTQSSSVPTAKLKEKQRKASSASDMTPDSIDSGASGKTSDMSEEIHAGPIPNQGKEEDLLSGNDMVDTSNFHDSDRLDHVDHVLNGLETLANGVSLSAATNGKHSVEEHNVGQNINLNLSNLSQTSAVGKRVSFKTSAKSSEEKGVDLTDNGYFDGTGDLESGSSRMSRLDLTNNERSSSLDDYYDLYQDSLYEETYSYMNMSLYGMMLPAIDFSLLFGADKDFQTFKESVTSKITTGKNLLKRGLEQIKQSQTLKPELHNIKQKSNDTYSSSKYLESTSSRPETIEKRSFWSFLQPFDTSDLIEVSKTTRNKVRDPEVLFNNDKLVMVLDEWIHHLHAAQKLVFSCINAFCQSSSAGSHSFQEDDTIKSSCSLITSTGSSPSENGDPSDRLETDEASISESKSFEDERPAESTSSITDYSDSSTLKTETLQNLLRVEDFVFVHDPFRLSAENHSLVSELAIMCLQSNVWGDLNTLKDAAFFLQKRETVERNLEAKIKEQASESQCTLGDGILQNGSANGDVDHHGEEGEDHGFARTSTPKRATSCDFKLSVTSPFSSANFPTNYISPVSKLDLLPSHDQSTAMLVQYYFHFLDVQRLRELLIVQNQPCFLTWTVLMKGAALLSSKDEFTQKINSGQIDAAANVLERSYSGAVLVAHLLRLFRAKPSRAIELCLHRSYHVTPLDVLFLSKSSNMPSEFFSYVTSIIDCLTDFQQPNVLNKMLHLDEVRLEWINTTLADGFCSHLKCKCGFPRPGSHLHPWKNSALLLHILSTSASNLDEKLLNLCYDFGFWKGFLWLAKKLKFYETLNNISVQLADIELLSTEIDYGYVPNTSEDWKELFLLVKKLNAQPDTAACLSCGEKWDATTSFMKSTDSSEKWKTTLQMESAAKVALSNLGPTKLLAVLKKIELPPGMFSSDFYRSVILTSVMDKQQSALSHRMLTNIGSYLWSKRPTSMSPEVYYYLLKEKQGGGQPPALPVLTNKVGYTSDSFKMYLEEPEKHWGMSASLKGSCEFCNMSLTSHLSSSSSGVIICICGHTYHTACLPTGMCGACIKTHHKDL